MYEVRKRLDVLAGRVSNLEMQLASLQNEVEVLRQVSENLISLVRENHRETLGLVRQSASSLESAVSIKVSDTQAFITQLNDDAADMARLHHQDLRTLATQNHADAWNADQLREQSLADAVLLSVTPRIEAMKREILALVGEKAVEVFRAQSNE
jgi:hypothetical protein